MKLDYILGLLFVALVVCKLAGVIAISWWWVFAPVFAWVGIVLTIWVIILAAAWLVSK
ncbi:hypothetical protein [Aestuariivirga sp.]|uniref:hypothetical protein n=1 Tax=Aestuariivirga sp. TaxID=2650926 RepID=UPI0039E696D0